MRITSVILVMFNSYSFELQDGFEQKLQALLTLNFKDRHRKEVEDLLRKSGLIQEKQQQETNWKLKRF